MAPALQHERVRRLTKMADTKKRAIRSTGSATIAFGMVSVPVKLYAGSTESSTRISFNLLHGACGHQYVVLIRPAGDGLLMHQLRYAEEVRTIEDVPVEELPAVDEKHLGLAVRLIEQNASAGFRPDVYIDEVRERMLAAIQRKV